MKNRNYISVFFDDEEPLILAVKKLIENKITIIDVLTPFPVHGLDKAMKMKPSRIPIVGFIFGALGGLLGFGFQSWVFTVDYPLIIGGKPYLSVPSFIPVTFEMTVLFAALGMVGAFLIKSKLKPKQNLDVLDERITDDRFVILLEQDDNSDNQELVVKEILAEFKPIETKMNIIDSK